MKLLREYKTLPNGEVIGGTGYHVIHPHTGIKVIQERPHTVEVALETGERTQVLKTTQDELMAVADHLQILKLD